MRGSIRAMALAIALSAGSATAGTVPGDLAARTSSALRDAVPGSEITIADPLTLKVHVGNGPEFTVALDGLARDCTRDEAQCPNAIVDFAGKIAATIATAAHDPGAPRTRKSLRAVVRGKDYYDYLGAMQKQAPKPSVFVSRPVAGNLVEMCYFDLEQGMTPAADEDLVKLGLDRAAAFALCEKNIHDALPALASVAKLDASGLGVLTGDPYESSYLLFHDDWAGVASAMHGPLLVSVPEADTVIFGPERVPDDAAAMSRGSMDVMKTAHRPVSAEVLRWTPAGWEVAAP